MKTRLFKTLSLILLLLAAPAAWAETVNCTPITTLPTVITSQGVYCLTGNLTTNMTSGNAIEIQTNNVTIDLNGWKLGGQAAGPGTLTNGIRANQRKNITIKNGTIRGFFYGIFLNDSNPYTTSQGHLIEDIRADNNTSVGMIISGRGNIVRRNQVVDTGGTTQVGNVYGILFVGPGGRVLNNDISGTAATGSSVGIGLRLYTAKGTVIEGNRIDDVSSGSGATYGIYIYGSNDVLARGNSITSAYTGIYYTGSTGKYMDTLTSNVTTPFFGGTAVGTND